MTDAGRLAGIRAIIDMFGSDADSSNGWIDHARFLLRLLDAATSGPPAPTDEQVETAAKAVWERFRDDLPWEGLHEDSKESVRIDARAALSTVQPRPSAPSGERVEAVNLVDEAARAICQRRNLYGDACIARNEGGIFTCVCGRRADFEADARAALSAIGTGEDAARPLEAALRNLLVYALRQECTHEGTHRGGVLWTICDDCGKQWADDEGGFVPYVEPGAIADARAALSAIGTGEDERVENEKLRGLPRDPRTG